MKKKYLLILLSISTCLINASQDPKDALEELAQLGGSSEDFCAPNTAKLDSLLNMEKHKIIEEAILKNNPKELKKIINSNGGKDGINTLLSTKNKNARLDRIKAMLPEAFTLDGGTIISPFDDLLSDAAFNKCDESVNVLLKKGANPLAKIDLGTKETVLHCIAKWSIIEKDKPNQAKDNILSTVLKHQKKQKQTVDPLNAKQQTPLFLHLCTLLHNRNKGLILSEQTALSFAQASNNVNQQDNYGDTPLNVCAALNFVETAKVLLKKGANANHKNKKGKSALDMAQDKKYYASEEMITLIRNEQKK